MPSKVTITAKQRTKYKKVGEKLINKKVTTGYQLEDYNPKAVKKKTITYSHDNRKHIRKVQKRLKGRVYPRESYYLWSSNWSPGVNTKLSKNKTRASSNEEYVQAPYSKKNWTILQDETFNKSSRHPISDRNTLWVVPDIRFYNTSKRVTHTHKAWNVTLPIDHNSRFSTVISHKKELEQTKKMLKGEKVQEIRVQHKHYTRNGQQVRGTNDSSFYNFISLKLYNWKRGRVI